MKKTKTRLFLLAVLVLIFTGSQSVLGLEYQIIDLGTLGGGESKAFGINEYDQIVGGAETASGQSHAFIYEEGVMTDIGTLGGNTSEAWGLNENGQIVGNSTNGAGRNRAFLYEDGVMYDLGTLGGSGSYARAINNAGQIACSAQISTGRWRAAIYENGQMRKLLIFSGSSWNSLSSGINASGQISGYSDVVGGTPWHACMWEDNTIIDLGTLPGTAKSIARGINNNGQIVGHSNNYPNPPVKGFIYEDGVMSGIGSLGHIPDDTRANEINNNGQIVGYSKIPAGHRHAFVYEDGIITDLGTLGGNTSEAWSINEAGLIAGYAETTEGDIHAVLWTPFMVNVAVDIKPRSCPNPLNVKSRGVLPVAVLGSEDFDVNTVDIASICLAGVGPVRSSYEDVAAPVSDANDCNCTTAGPDGYTDLTLKFETYKIVNAIGEVTDGEVLPLTIAGVLLDETHIEGADCIVIRGSHKPFNKADITKDGVVDILDFAIIAESWLQSSIVDD